MPIYVYENIETGEVVEEFRNINNTDPLPGFIRVYQPLGLIGANSGGVCHLERELMKDYKTYEERHGSGSVKRDIGISEKGIKNAVGNYVEKYKKEDIYNTEIKNGAVVS